ncbi:MAG: sensor domain-containing diguanylate cyclase [Thermoleophilia bacterium]|nr:sensor domain-containing diguanylate cyclase [Thermoleophilia bacterium]
MAKDRNIGSRRSRGTGGTRKTGNGRSKGKVGRANRGNVGATGMAGSTGKPGNKNISGFTIAGKILFANCAIVAAGAFTGTWITRQFVDQPRFVLGTILFTGGLLVSLPVNYLAVRSALKPLRLLSSAMEEVREGNLEANADIGGSSDRQIAMLSESYRTMLEWIREDRRTIEKLSLIDPLTEIGNTRALNSGLETEIARINRYGESMPAAFSVLIIDLDRFKEINDTCGHLTGDAVLRDTALLLQKSLRKTDTTLAALKHYRFGGDEFVVIAPHTSLAGAKILAERLDEAVMSFSFTTHDGTPLEETSVGQVRASVGYASYPEETANADELMDLADKRMYEVKERRAGVKELRSNRGLRSLPDMPARVIPDSQTSIPGNIIPDASFSQLESTGAYQD